VSFSELSALSVSALLMCDTVPPVTRSSGARGPNGCMLSLASESVSSQHSPRALSDESRSDCRALCTSVRLSSVTPTADKPTADIAPADVPPSFSVSSQSPSRAPSSNNTASAIGRIWRFGICSYSYVE
jgi:hypothetical protein